MPCSLAELVPTFGLIDCTDKPFFPHMVNNTANYGKILYPSKEDYLCEGFMPKKMEQFDQWYEQHKNEPFILDEQLGSYCVSGKKMDDFQKALYSSVDVDILLAAFVAFRIEFMELTKRPVREDGTVDRAASDSPHDGIDPLEKMTIASNTMKTFRTNHLKANHLAIVPEKVRIMIFYGL